jgi:hypothetical protein
MNYTDVMLDLETLGNKSNSPILSIGAVEFNIKTGEIGREFYTTVDLQSCLDVGLKVNGSTFYWWMQQSDAARKAVCEPGYDLQLALRKFEVWIQGRTEKINIWGNGARFDIGLLEDAYVACGYQDMPWYFRSERDVRTLVAFAPEIKVNTLFTGVEHNPIDDCKHQIAYCHKIWKKLNK